ncbi:MAG: alpha-L-fucosidase [Balneolaceae bacterium]
MKRFNSILIAITVIFHFHTEIILAQSHDQPSPENIENREWFQDNKYGLFIHWGIYSVMAGGGDYGIAEWIMNEKEIPITAYEKLATFFNPVEFDANEWVSIAKKAGMRYITITTKHHDGFAMYHSQVSDYNIVDRTPFGRDIIKELKDACDREGIKLFFYYSQLDWHHPDYYPRGRTGGNYTGRPNSGEWRNYIDYMKDQLTELLTNYGEIGGIWFDGQWDKYEENWYLDEIYSHIHSIQPGALIGSNHHLDPTPGEDFQMFERDLPGENTMGYSQTNEISELPLEMCETMNGSWGYNIKDRNFKSSDELLRTLIRAAGYGSNFLLNTGPMPNGQLQPENVDTLMVMANWLNKYGETIYGTRKGPIEPQPWGVTTSKDDLIYLHLLDYDREILTIPHPGNEIESIFLFNGQIPLDYTSNEQEIEIIIPFEYQKPLETILVFNLK